MSDEGHGHLVYHSSFTDFHFHLAQGVRGFGEAHRSTHCAAIALPFHVLHGQRRA